MAEAADSPTVIGLLTGGRSTRMGTDKAQVMVAGRSMAQRVADTCVATGLETVVLGPHDAGTGLAAVTDDDDVPAGPLGGLITLLRARPGRRALLVATDQPFVRVATLLALAEVRPAAAVVVPMHDDQPQVTCARYGAEVLAEFEARRGSDAEIWRLRALLDDLPTHRVLPDEWKDWGEDGRSFRSLDRPEDVTAALADYGGVEVLRPPIGRGPGAV